jgi:hypothetical protein
MDVRPNPTEKVTPDAYTQPLPDVRPQARGAIFGPARRFLRTHRKKLWWLHSAYALILGGIVVAFAQKGFDHARWLAVSLALAWLLVAFFFRVFGSGVSQESVEYAPTRVKLRFYAMTYALKNLYQGMLFFLLPFYWKAATFDSVNAWFAVLLVLCTLLSTLDVVFDRVLMKWRVLASIFHGVTLFACMNLVVPALIPETRTLVSLLVAAAITVLFFWTLHVPFRAWKEKRNIALFALSLAGGVTAIYFVRRAIPPAPMYLASAAVGPSVLADGRLAMEVKTLHASVIQELLAVTDVVVPGGRGDHLRHVWRHDGIVAPSSTEDTAHADRPHGIVRLQSKLDAAKLVADAKTKEEALGGKWTVDVETEDDQLVGRTRFTVVE